MTQVSSVTDVTVIESVDSTNDAAKRRLAEGPQSTFCLAAKQQTSGRGRTGRAWSSMSGNLAMTLYQPIRGTYQGAARLSFAVSLAVKDTLEELAPKESVRIKWPNDVLLNQRKVCGILLENIGTVTDDTLGVLIGIGLNLASHPEPHECNWPPTSVAAETGFAPSFDSALSSLLRSVPKRIESDITKGFNATRQDWLSCAVRLGEIVSVRLPNTELRGRFMDIDETGALVLDTPSGVRKITAGDVFFPEDAECS